MITHLWKMPQRQLVVTIALLCSPAPGWAQQTDEPAAEYPPAVQKYLQRIYLEDHRKFTYRDGYPGGLRQWQHDARTALRRLIGLDTIRAQVGEHPVSVRLEETQDLDTYTRRRGWIETEPDVRIPFWLLRPKGPGPFPLAVLPHGHDRVGHDSHAGVYHDDKHRQKVQQTDKDVAVQAVSRGFLAIAPATRGLAVDGVPDVFERHGGRDCRSQLMHCLLAGRTAIGERVWDLTRLLDWALQLPAVDARRVLMMGNSGGGMATLYTAAMDARITVAVPSCSFTTVTSADGRIYHCDCNAVPGILNWGDLYDVAGLIAPRRMLAVNGRKDRLHAAAAIERAAQRAHVIFRAAGHGERFRHAWGAEGHRFYSDLMWPFVMAALQDRS
jgi:dienelactone hydrolase